MMPEGTAVTLLLQALLRTGGSRRGDAPAELSTVVGLLDTYSETVQSTAPTEYCQRILLDTLYTAYSTDTGAFVLILEEMVRRGHISSDVVASWVVDPVLLGQLHTDPWVYSILEMAVDRGLDFVKATIAESNRLSGVGSMVLSLGPEDGSIVQVTRLSPAVVEAPTIIVEAPVEEEEDVVMAVGAKRGAADDDEVDYEDDDNSSRRTRFRRDDGSVGMGGAQLDAAVSGGVSAVEGTAAGVVAVASTSAGEGEVSMTAEDEGDDDPVANAQEALKLAVHTSRSVFNVTVPKLVEGIVKILEGTAEGNEEDNSVWADMATSVLHRTMRAYIAAERSLSKAQGSLVLLSMQKRDISELFVNLPVVQSTWDRQLLL